jgi:tetratricopeptide (TPR) repeat protein
VQEFGRLAGKIDTKDDKERVLLMVKPLEKAVDDAVMAEGNIAYDLKQKGRFEEAEAHYLKMWELFPEPKYDWDWSQQILNAIAEFYLEWQKYDKALFWANEVFKCGPLPGDGSPYLFLGKIYYEAGDLDEARRQLTKAFQLSGRRTFQGEDPKYFRFLKEKAK